MQITFDFAAKRIVLDGAESELLALIEAARKIAPSLPQLTVNSTISTAQEPPRQPNPNTPPNGGNPASQRPSGNGMTMRDFVRSLSPKTHHQRIAGIGYFVKVHENQSSFSPKEMDSWYTACGFPKPSQMPIALSDAKKVRYVSNSGYGQWKVERDGENWVIGQLNQPRVADQESGG